MTTDVLAEMLDRLVVVSEATETDDGVPTSVWEEFVDDYGRLLAFASAARDELAQPNPTTAAIAQALDRLENP